MSIIREVRKKYAPDVMEIIYSNDSDIRIGIRIMNLLEDAYIDGRCDSAEDIADKEMKKICSLN